MKKNLLIIGIVFALLSVTSIPVFAAGNGYAPGNNTISSDNAAAAFSTVLAANTFDNTGGSLKASSNNTFVELDVPPNAFNGKQVILATGDPSSLTNLIPAGNSVITNFAVNFDGVPTAPITFIINNNSIPANGKVFKLQSGNLIPISATVKAGQAKITFQNDPEFVVLAPSGAIKDATSPQTGIPLAEDLSYGASMLIFGIVLVFLTRKKKSFI